MRQRTHYEVLGVAVNSSLAELRNAYRRRARQCHPDLSDDPAASPSEMALLNEAWRVLSDEERRKFYDLTVENPLVEPQPAPQTRRQRRDAWVAGIRAQILHLSHMASRSATQTMLNKNPLATREQYNLVADDLVQAMSVDIEARVRSARAAGVAPLDLAVAAILVGIRSEADGLRRLSSLGINVDLKMRAQLLDRMWDVLAHELPNSAPIMLGGNPSLGRFLAER